MRTARILITFICALILAAPAIADQPIRFIVPYTAGGTADIMARIVAGPLGTALGTSVIVENQPGAAGTLALATVSRARPDGLTLVFTNTGPSSIAPSMNKSVTYDPAKDFAAVSLVARSPLLLVVNPTVDFKDLKGLIAYAKAKPGGIEYSSPGIGSFTHLATERFAQAAGIHLVHVPYKGQAPAITAVVAGEVKMSLTSPSAMMFDMVRNGKLRLLGVTTRDPSDLAPGAAPIAQVLPGFETEFWFGVLAPAKTSPATVAKLHDAIQKVLSDPAIAKQFEATGSAVATGPSDQFQRMLGTEAAVWHDVVTAAKIDPEN